MSEPVGEPQETYVYRRVSPRQFVSKKNEITPDVFALGTAIKGLSVYHADSVSPRGALQTVIEDRRKQLASTDEEVIAKAQEWLNKNPDVETLIGKGWRIVKLPVSEVKALGFDLEEPDTQGHLNILGERSQFDDHIADFTELLNTGKATLLSAEECRQAE